MIARRRIVKGFLRSLMLNAFCLQETKMQSMSESIVWSLGTSRFLE